MEAAREQNPPTDMESTVLENNQKSCYLENGLAWPLRSQLVTVESDSWSGKLQVMLRAF